MNNTGVFFCGVSEQFGDGSPQMRLPESHVTFRVDGDLPNIPRAELEDACFEAWMRWARKVGITVDKHANTKTDPVQIVRTRSLDGPSGVLADQQLPYGKGRGLIMRLDLNERWCISDHPPQGMINILAVLTHEDGHAMGLSHISPEGTPDLMNATYSRKIFVPQPDDISYAVKLYGEPTAPKPTAPGGGTSPRVSVRVEVDGKWYVANGQTKPE